MSNDYALFLVCNKNKPIIKPLNVLPFYLKPLHKTFQPAFGAKKTHFRIMSHQSALNQDLNNFEMSPNISFLHEI